MIFDPNINTCIIPSYASLRILANYSHIIPITLSLILGIFVLIKAKFDFFSKIFLAFVGVFSLWLIGDVIIWTSSNYYLIYALWSPLVYLEIIFYVIGFYFATVLTKKSDINLWQKTLLLAATLIPFLITITGKSVTGFDYPTCLAFNNSFLDTYKLYLEILILGIIFVYAFIPFFEKSSLQRKKSHIIVLGSMFLFLSVFGITEYLGSVTADYRINLYSLFLLPIFLVAIIYAVFELDIFNVKILGTHYLVVGLVVLMGGQLFFITDTTSKLITILAMVLASALSVILFRNLKRESDQRTEIAKLNVSLQDSIKQRESLMHLINHKVKGSFTRSKYIFAGLLDGTFGETSPEVIKYAKIGLDSDNGGIQTIDLVLNADNLMNGTIKYEVKDLDFKDTVLKSIADKKVQADTKKLTLETNIKEDDYHMLGDVFWLKEAVNNLIDNSIRYTREGKIIVGLEKKNKKILLSVKDTGMGITDEDKQALFTQGGRGKDSVKINVDSTGYGLYSVKLIITAHKGRIWAESEVGKGSTFFIELPATT